MSKQIPPEFMQFRLPENYFMMSEKEQKTWISEYLKKSIGQRLILEPQENKDQTTDN